MQKYLSLFTILFTLFSCNLKNIRELHRSGNYDEVINRSLKTLEKNKISKSKQEYIFLLEDAFAKAKAKDLQDLNKLKREADPIYLERIYNLYLQLNERQEKISTVLPLKLLKQNKNATFLYDDYSGEIKNVKNELSKYLYDSAVISLSKPEGKFFYRKAYNEFMHLESINPRYKNTDVLMKESLLKGTNFVHVFIKNEANIRVSKKLEADSLNLNTSGLNNQWTIYHNNKEKNTKYDFSISINILEIIFSPEEIKEKVYHIEKSINDGQKTIVDNNGNKVTDTLGNELKEDDYKLVEIEINEYKQMKSCQIIAKINYSNLKTNEVIQSFQINGTYDFINTYATYKGDKLACDESYWHNFKNTSVQFPNDHEMIYEAGEDLKIKAKNVIIKNRFTD